MNKKTRRKWWSVLLACALVCTMAAAPAGTTEAASKKYVKSLKISKSSLSLTAGATGSVKATVSVKGSVKKTVTAKSSAPGVVAVKVGKASKKGVSVITMTAKAPGQASITVKTSGKSKAKKAIQKKIAVTVSAGGASDAGTGQNSTIPTAAPNEQTPATQAPTTQTQAPVTQAPDTQTPVTQAPATQAPTTSETEKPGDNPANPETTTVPPITSDGFTASDYEVEYDTVDKEVKFVINEMNITAEELEAQGYTIEMDPETNQKVASKMNTLAVSTYTFKKLPATLDELKLLDLKSEVKTVNGVELDYGMLKPLVSTILAIHSFQPTPGVPLDDKNPVMDMFQYLEGPSQTIPAVQKQNAYNYLKNNANLDNCYFVGASPSNSYTPKTPLQIRVEEGPYYIPAKETITGKRPETHMVFVFFEGADAGRYIDVFKSSDGNWYSWDNNFLHLLASVKDVEIEW